MKTFIFFVMVLASLPLFASEHHFFDVIREDGGWRAYHWSAESGKLQELVSSRSFQVEAEARLYVARLKKRFPVQKNFAFVSDEPGTAPLWNVTKSWDRDWEKKFSEWISKEFDAEFFNRPGLETDCADVAYSLRWIFARNNGLPAAGTLAGSGILATHLSAKAEWNNLPGDPVWHKDQRFMAALRWLLSNVYTKTLNIDGYPVALNRESINAGLINLLGGHTEIFARVSYDKGEVPFQLLSSTVPQAVRTLHGRVFLDPEVTDQEDGGLIKFRWPVKNASGAWTITPKEEMWDHSVDQYKEDLCEEESQFAFCLMKILGIEFDRDLIARKLIADFKSFIDMRIQVVKDGSAFCQLNDCTPGTMGYEDWSTPSRDKRLTAALKTTREILSSISRSNDFEAWLTETTINVPGPMNLRSFTERLDNGLTSYDPRDTQEQRWALNPAAIEMTLMRKYNEANSLRNDLINSAASCRANPVSCQKSAESYRTLSTAELDLSIAKNFGNWIDFANDYRLKVNDEILSVFTSLWGRSPAPWDPIELRNGKTHKSAHFLHADTVMPGAGTIIILDKKKLYDFSTRKEIVLNIEHSEIYFDTFTKRYLARDRRQLRILDENFRSLARFELSGVAETFHKFHNFGNGIIYLSDYANSENYETSKTGWTLDLKTLRTSNKYSFAESVINEDSIIMYATGKSFMSLFYQDGQISFKELPWPGENSGFQVLHIDGHKYFLSFYEGDIKICLLSAEGCEPVQSLNERGYLLKLNSNFFSFQGWDSGGSFLYNVKSGENQVVDPQWFPMIGNDRALFVDDERSVVLLDGETERELPIRTNKYISVLSAGKEWFSLTTGEIFDYEGREMRNDRLFSLGICGKISENNFCSTKNEESFQEDYRYQGREDTYFTYSRIGKKDGLAVGETMAYYPLMVEDEYIMNVVDNSSSSKISTGTSVRISNSMILWYP